MVAGRRTGSPRELPRCNGVVGAVKRAAAVATIAITGCAGWVEADDPWFDAPSAELSPAIVYGYDWRLHECISATVRRWTFPVPPGVRPSVVRYPYVFSATRARR
jgi:hypothetical protein